MLVMLSAKLAQKEANGIKFKSFVVKLVGILITVQIVLVMINGTTTQKLAVCKKIPNVNSAAKNHFGT